MDKIHKLIFVTIIFTALALPCFCFAEDIYIAQTSAGSNTGDDCANAHNAAWFNNLGNWANPKQAGKIGPGDTAHLCGTINSELYVQKSGSPSSSITILWQPWSKLSQPAGTHISTNGYSYLIIDGGTNGVIENTANGTQLANQLPSNAINALGSSYIEIKNLTIQNLYVRTSTTDQKMEPFGGANSTQAIKFGGSGVTNVSVHDCKINHAVAGIYCSASSALSNISIYNNKFSNIDHNIAIGASAGTISNVSIYGNSFSDYYNWDDTVGNRYHHNALHIYTVGAATFDGFYVYRNTFSGDTGNLSTSHFYFENGGGGTFNNLQVYNNLLLQPTNSAGIWQIAVGSTKGNAITNSRIANNTIFGIKAANHYGIVLSGGVGNQIVVENNAIIGCNSAIFEYVAVPNVTFNNNLYSGNTYIGGGHSILADWRTHLGGTTMGDDHNATDAVHGLSSLGVPSIGSGTVDVGKTQSTFSTDYAGNERKGTWDIGAYEYVPLQSTLFVTSANGTVTSNPSGINCGSTCYANFDAESWVSLNALPNSGYTFAGWSGGGCAGTGTCTINMTMSMSVSAIFNPSFNNAAYAGAVGGGGGCFIATAAYGSYLDPHVYVLRKFRDNYLQTNYFGKKFVEFYYRNSPPVAKVIASNEIFKKATRWALTPIVYSIEYTNVTIMFSGLIILALVLWKRVKIKRAILNS